MKPELWKRGRRAWGRFERVWCVSGVEVPDSAAEIPSGYAPREIARGVAFRIGSAYHWVDRAGRRVADRELGVRIQHDEEIAWVARWRPRYPWDGTRDLRELVVEHRPCGIPRALRNAIWREVARAIAAVESDASAAQPPPARRAPQRSREEVLAEHRAWEATRPAHLRTLPELAEIPAVESAPRARRG